MSTIERYREVIGLMTVVNEALRSVNFFGKQADSFDEWLLADDIYNKYVIELEQHPDFEWLKKTFPYFVIEHNIQ